MPARLQIDNGVINRRDLIDHSEGDKSRRRFRDMSGRRIRNNPLQEMFVWTQEEDRLLRKIRPELFEGSAQDRQKALRAFAQTSEGKAFLCR